MPRILRGGHSAGGYRFGIVVSRFNGEITDALLKQALQALSEHGVDTEQVDVAQVPGAFEIPLAAKKMALSRQYHAVICLGAVIRGETPHFEYIASEVTRGISEIALETGVPVLYGVLTTETMEQARERSLPGVCAPGGKAAGFELNRGRETALAAIEMVNLMDQIK